MKYTLQPSIRKVEARCSHVVPGCLYTIPIKHTDSYLFLPVLFLFTCLLYHPASIIRIHVAVLICVVCPRISISNHRPSDSVWWQVSVTLLDIIFVVMLHQY